MKKLYFTHIFSSISFLLCIYSTALANPNLVYKPGWPVNLNKNSDAISTLVDINHDGISEILIANGESVVQAYDLLGNALWSIPGNHIKNNLISASQSRKHYS